VKGSIHILAGDEDRGKQIIEGKKMWRKFIRSFQLSADFNLHIIW
jgi:hypothetical protein